MTSPTCIKTHLNYHLAVKDDGSDQAFPGTAGDKLRRRDRRVVDITDMRGHQPILDREGFQLVKHGSREKAFDDEARVKTKVYDETSDLLRLHTGASHVVPFSHIIRRHTWQTSLDAAAKAASPDEIVPFMNPAHFIHVDQSYEGAVRVLEDQLPASEVQRLSKTRWGIINVWRPFQIVKREPLAVCDSSSIQDGQLRQVTAVLPEKGKGTFDRVSKGASFDTWELAYSPEHRWYYASYMTPDEVLLIKCFDSKKDGRARRSPHSAFQTDDDHGPPRQSIEVRCLVFWEDEDVE